MSPLFRKYPLGNARTVLVPNQWNGSVQQYYHFLLGYLAPVFAWSRKNPGKAFAVRDCGPMNRWFELLRPQWDVEVMNVGDVLHVLAGQLQPTKILRGMDFPDSFVSHDIQEFADTTRRLAAGRFESRLDERAIIVSDRASSDEFFSTPAAEWPESGSQKRSVPNLRDVVLSWNRSDVNFMDAATVDIYEQILAHSSARILIGQHGAGLTNMIWMPTGSHIIEILPPMPADAQEIFAKLASAMGMHYSVVEQASVHAPVDADLLTQALSRIRD